MERVELFYKKLVEVTCLICKTDPVMMFSCNKEKFVDARSLVIMNLVAKRYTDNHISELTGLTRQAVNRIRNTFPDRFNRSWTLINYQQEISKELARD